MATAGRNLAKAGAALQRRLQVETPVICTKTGQTVRPWRIGLGEQLVALAKDGKRGQVRSIVKSYTGRTSYLRALSEEGAERHDLIGTPVGSVSEKHREHAAEKLAERLAWKRRKREAEKAMDQAAERPNWRHP